MSKTNKPRRWWLTPNVRQWRYMRLVAWWAEEKHLWEVFRCPAP